ncbi:2-keto-4-pentenoate hydratase [Trinickia dabaoshanensis]|uniref:2-keto-4-pentenoate hydratase n=2 Tax=Trinickia dabaoshanensis TaxID=564714 RepID=A0A2N7W029_9BURK|nr:2-keto-4-pentenoate hydratase [Trinickia dabaoshanensis]
MERMERIERLARMLASARAAGPHARIAELPDDLAPASEDEAYAVQDAILRAMNQAAGGWKIGAKSAGGPAQGAPLPACDVHRGPATLARAAYAKPGLELEVAFVLGSGFRADAGPPSETAVRDAIASVHAAIEVVASRFAGWPDIDRRRQLADLQNNGALVVGEGVPYDAWFDAHFPFVSPSMRFTFDGIDIAQAPAANPAGDPRWLPYWLVNHCIARGLDLAPGTVLTCGSYTGMHFPAGAGVARGEIDGLPAVELTLT